MIVNNVFLEKVAVNKSNYPETSLIEIAFAGKSNVGKSSLINTMINRKNLARKSQNPGKTRTINFYNVEEMMYFVDLPGYGYAKAPKSEKETWGKMIENYLLEREELKAIILLIDIRHEPSENDVLMYNWLKHYNYEIIIVATKLDKLGKNQIDKNISVIRKKLNLAKVDTLIPFSSETKAGREELWEKLLKYNSFKGGEM
ncbi:MAG: ribosome biogenesis GTP-binding protein YihA/YsxC [Defluviitaleaceae bacterium]|nr:ribosome biogenesis GTP-binding protein YihA/YsxC [Defluviitaleaceae bacterium]